MKLILWRGEGKRRHHGNGTVYGTYSLTLFFFLGPHQQDMEVHQVGVELELELPAYATATATPDPRNICDLHHSSWQCRILNPLSKARD